MKDSLKAGLETKRRYIIDRDRTISFMGEELRVYATPWMARDIEETCRLLIMEHMGKILWALVSNSIILARPC